MHSSRLDGIRTDQEPTLNGISVVQQCVESGYVKDAAWIQDAAESFSVASYSYIEAEVG